MEENTTWNSVSWNQNRSGSEPFPRRETNLEQMRQQNISKIVSEITTFDVQTNQLLSYFAAVS